MYDTRWLYEYAKEKYPDIAEFLAHLDQEIADHQTQALDLVRSRLHLLKTLREGENLENAIRPVRLVSTSERLMFEPLDNLN